MEESYEYEIINFGSGVTNIINQENQNNVIIGFGSDFNSEKVVRECTIIGSDSFIEKGENCTTLGNNIKLSEDNDTKDAIYIGNTKQKLYLTDNNEMTMCASLQRIMERINNVYSALNKPESRIYMPINNKYIDINALIASYENRLCHLEDRLNKVAKAILSND